MITIESLTEQAKEICKCIIGFELVDDEYIPMCKMGELDERVCVSGYDNCLVYSQFDTRIKSIQKLANIATKLHKG